MVVKYVAVNGREQAQVGGVEIGYGSEFHPIGDGESLILKLVHHIKWKKSLSLVSCMCLRLPSTCSALDGRGCVWFIVYPQSPAQNLVLREPF